MARFSISPLEMFATLWRHRDLVRVLVQRDVLGRYRGSVLGIAWSFFTPVLMLAVYTFVFSVVFQARWGAREGSRAEFAFVLFAGMIVFNLFSECVNRAPASMLANANYVKKVVFPLEILPWVAMGSALFHALVSVGVWLLAYAVFIGPPHGTAALLPLTVIPMVLLVMGVSWGLASLGVYLRDASQVVGIVTTIVMFLSPVFYPASAVPEAFRWVIELNPLSAPIEEARGVLMFGRAPAWGAFMAQLVLASIVAWLGFAWFQKTRGGFADVL